MFIPVWAIILGTALLLITSNPKDQADVRLNENDWVFKCIAYLLISIPLLLIAGVLIMAAFSTHPIISTLARGFWIVIVLTIVLGLGQTNEVTEKHGESFVSEFLNSSRFQRIYGWVLYGILILMTVSIVGAIGWELIKYTIG